MNWNLNFVVLLHINVLNNDILNMCQGHYDRSFVYYRGLKFHIESNMGCWLEYLNIWFSPIIARF